MCLRDHCGRFLKTQRVLPQRPRRDAEDGGCPYDANGNRTSTSTQVITQSSIEHDYATDLNNRIEGDGLNRYYDDEEGNIIRKVALVDGSPTGETTKYTCDFHNRLTAVTRYASWANYQSDDQVSRVVYCQEKRSFQAAATGGQRRGEEAA